MTTTPNYTPTDEFRDHLEQEVRRTFRRATREHAARDVRGTRWAKAAAVVAVSASIGATAGFASAQSRQAAGRDSLLATVRAEAVIAQTRADLARAQADDVAMKVRAGALDSQALDDATAELRQMEARRNRAGLNLEEITASGLPVRDDLAAPLVASKDFVKLRLELDLTIVDARLKEAEGHRAIAEQRARLGAAVDGNLSTATVDVARARGEMSVLAEELKLRADFLNGSAPAELLPQRVEAVRLRADADVVQAQLGAAQARLALVEQRKSYGLADDVELLRAQLAVKEQELALQKIGLRLRTAK